MDLGKLRGKIQHEGYLKKAPQAKGQDKFRRGWKERYFVLKPKVLFYYKKKGDVKHAGKVDLSDAIVAHADENTKDSHTFKVKQSKQFFLYLKAESDAARDDWILAMVQSGASFQRADGTLASRQDSLMAASADTEELALTVTEEQLAVRLCWGVMFKDSHDDLYHERLVLQLDPATACLSLVKDGATVKTLKVNTFDSITHATAVEDRLPNGKQLIPVKFDVLNGTKALRSYQFGLGTARDAKELADALYNVVKDELAQLVLRLNYPPLQYGTLELRMGDASSRWTSVWAVLDTGKLMVFHNAYSRLPTWVVSVEQAKFRKEGKHQIEVEASFMEYGLRLKRAKDCSDWFRNLVLAQKSYTARVDEQFQLPQKTLSKTSENLAVDMTEIVNSTDYIVVCGAGKSGQLGLRGKDDCAVPTAIDFLRAKKIAVISCSQYGHFAMALSRDGTLYGWGESQHGALGSGEQRTALTSPTLLSDLKTVRVQSVDCGAGHVLAVSAEGELWAWGKGDKGQLGHGLTDDYFYPKVVDLLKKQRVHSVSAGGEHSACIVGEKKELYVWGANDKGQLGNGTLLNCDTPQKSVVCKKGPVVQVSLGKDFTTVIVEPHKVYSWGSNAHGKLGLGDSVDRDGPIKLPYFSAKEIKVTRISCGAEHALALTDSGKVYAWGKADCSALMKGKDKVQPSKIKVLDGVEISDVVAGAYHSFFVGPGGVFGYGRNDYGQLAIGRMRQENEFVETILKKTLLVCAGPDYSIALVQDDGSDSFVDTSLTGSEFNKQFQEKSNLPVGPPASSKLPVVKLGDMIDHFGLSSDSPMADIQMESSVKTVGKKPNEQENASVKPQAPPMVAPSPPTPIVSARYVAPPRSDSVSEQYSEQELFDAWRESVCPNTGAAYFYNKLTKDRVWATDMDEKLLETIRGKLVMRRQSIIAMREPPPVATKGWKSAVDPSSGRTYYYNKGTGERRWTDPNGS